MTLAAPYRQMLKLHLLDTVVFAEANMVSILLLLHVKYRSGSRIRSDLHGFGPLTKLKIIIPTVAKFKSYLNLSQS